jgi:signal transduction histidine kinase
LHLYAGLLARPGVLRPEHQHYATEIELIAERGSRLHRQLIGTESDREGTLYRSTSSDTQDTNEPGAETDLIAVLHELSPLLTRVAAPAKLTLDVPEELPNVAVSANVVERIILNLVSNAAEAIATTPTQRAQQGQIQVTLSMVNGRLQLEVEDDGPGMPPAVAATFFRPLAQTTSRRRLGHRIIHELARSSGASLDLRVRPGRGTYFCFQWPQPPQISTDLPGNSRQTGVSRTC